MKADLYENLIEALDSYRSEFEALQGVLIELRSRVEGVTGATDRLSDLADSPGFDRVLVGRTLEDQSDFRARIEEYVNRLQTTFAFWGLRSPVF